MELKRYIEKDSKTALEKIRNLHGDDALIVSTEKVGNKTEVIVGVEETKEEYPGDPHVKRENSSPSATQTASPKLGDGNTQSKENAKRDPWKFVDELNKEISLIKKQIASISENPGKSKEPDIHAIDREIKDQGHNLDPVEKCLSEAGTYLIIGCPGSGKSTIIEKIIFETQSQGFSHVRCTASERIDTERKTKSAQPSTHIGSSQQLDSFRNLSQVFDQILIETDLSDFAAPSSFLHECDASMTRVVCIPMDQDAENIRLLLKDLSDFDVILVLTRLDLCTNLPSKLELILKSDKKIFGTSTGAY